MDLEPISPSDALELYAKERQAELADATIRSHRSRLGHFVDWCEKENIENMNNLTGRDIHQYRIWRREEGDITIVTEKTQMDTLRVFLRWCESIDAVPVDLSLKVHSPDLADGDNVRDVMLDPETAEAILEYLETYEYASERHVCLQLMWGASLRRGSVCALDLDDYDSAEQMICIRHRPETGTPIKNKERGERYIALKDETCAVIDAWIADRRPEVTDDAGRDPLLATPQGRVHPTTIQTYVYSVTTPCLWTGECPHDRSIESCAAANNRTKASKCPSSVSPHAVRRGSITHWLAADVPEPIVSDRANASSEILRKHYDQRSAKAKAEQRRDYLDNI